MTTLTKKITRQTAVQIQRRPLVVELSPRGLALYEKRTRARFSVSWDAVYDLARKLAARDDRRGRW